MTDDSESDAPGAESEPPTWDDDSEVIVPRDPAWSQPAETSREGETLRVAIAGSITARALPTLTEVCAALGRELGQRTSGHLMVSYDELLAGAEHDDFHVMWLPPLVARKALASGSAAALAVPVRAGSTGYATALFTRDDSAIENLEQLAGTKVGWVDKNSLAGYVLPRALLRGRGLEGVFDAEVILGSHEAVVAAVVAGKVDVGATYAHVERSASGDETVASKALDDRPIRILAHHGPVPADIVAVGRGVDAAARDRLRDMLITAPEAEVTRLFCSLLECDGFERVEPDQLHALDELATDP